MGVIGCDGPGPGPVLKQAGKKTEANIIYGDLEMFYDSFMARSSPRPSSMPWPARFVHLSRELTMQ
jgi:hypothetical protein